MQDASVTALPGLLCHAHANAASPLGTCQTEATPRRTLLATGEDLLVTSSSAGCPAAEAPAGLDLGSRTQLREGCAWGQSLCNPSKHGAEIAVQDCSGHRGCTISMLRGQASCSPGAEAAAEA